MEVDPKKDVLAVDQNKDVEGMEIVPPPCTMLQAVVIEGMYVCGPGLEGLCVRVPMYNNTFR